MILRFNLVALAAALALALPLRAQVPPSVATPAGISDPLGYEQQPFDVLHYDAELDLTKAPTPYVKGVCDITLRWVPGVPDEHVFRFHLRSLRIVAAFLDGAPVDVTTVGDSTSATYHHEISVPPTADPPDTSVVRIVYDGTMTDELGSGAWGGVGSSSGILFAMGVGFRNNYVSTTEHWLPCYDHPSDKATFTGRFKVLDPMVVAGNGTLDITRRGDTAVYEWTEDHPAATYLLMFAVGPYVRMNFGSDPAPMLVYSKAADTAATRRSFTLLPRMVRVYERLFGRYPYAQVGYVNTPIGSMEHQGMISFAASISRSRDTVNMTAAHELAHQWFGDLVTPRDFRHAWLSESFATFSECLWAEELRGPEGYIAMMRTKDSTYRTRIAAREGVFPLFDFPRAQPSSNYPETIYQKGAVVLGMLRYEMGDSAFFGGLRDYLQRFAYGAATTEDFREAMERHSKGTLDWFFNQWVYGAGWPVISATATRQQRPDGAWNVTVTISQSASQGDTLFHWLPVELGFVNDTSTLYRMVRLDDRQATVTIDSVPDYSRMTINAGPTVRALMQVRQIASVLGPADSSDVTITVRPNPADGRTALTVKVGGTTDCSSLRYDLFDASGRRLGTGRSDSCEFTIPIDGLPSGALVLRFRLRDVFYDVPVAITR